MSTPAAAARLSGSEVVGGFALTCGVLGTAVAALVVSGVATRAGRRPAPRQGYEVGALGGVGAAVAISAGSAAGLLVALGAPTAAGLSAGLRPDTLLLARLAQPADPGRSTGRRCGRCCSPPEESWRAVRAATPIATHRLRRSPFRNEQQAPPRSRFPNDDHSDARTRTSRTRTSARRPVGSAGLSGAQGLSGPQGQEDVDAVGEHTEVPAGELLHAS